MGDNNRQSFGQGSHRLGFYWNGLTVQGSQYCLPEYGLCLTADTMNEAAAWSGADMSSHLRRQEGETAQSPYRIVVEQWESFH